MTKPLLISSYFWLYFPSLGATEKVHWLCKRWRAFHKECVEEKKKGILDFDSFTLCLLKFPDFTKE